MSGVNDAPSQVVPSAAAPPAEPPPTHDAFDPSEPGDATTAGPARPLRLRPLGARSLTGRLTAGVVGLVVVIVLLVSSGTFYALQSFLYTRFKQQLSSAADSNADFIRGCLPQFAVGLTCHLHGLPPTQQEWLAVLDSEGNPLPLISDATTPLQLGTPVAKQIAADTTQLRTVQYARTELQLEARDIGPFIVVTGLSTSEVHRTLRRLVYLELIIGAVAVALAAAATGWGVRFGLRGLRRVTSTAQQVAAELSPTGAGLDRRVPGEDDSTEVGQLAASMNTLLAAVETQFAARLQSEARLRRFLADASHELRTPLTSIRGYAELARMQRAAGSNEDDNLARIEAEGMRMSRLVEDLLTLARSDRAEGSASAARELVDLADVIEEVAAGARAAHPDRRIELAIEPGLQVLGDPDQLVRALRNLVTNAAVHTAPGRPIRVEGRSDRGDAVLRVLDAGPGLPPDEAAHVFERFWRADKARSRARGGSGLGLAIVASIVQAHGGSVRFDSSVETGTTVTMRLPRVTG